MQTFHEAARARQSHGVRTAVALFGITVRAIRHALSPECGHQLRMVVNLAVVDYLEIAVVARHGLLPVSDVDDAQPPVAEGDSIVQVDPSTVRPAMRDRIPHPFQQFRVQPSARSTWYDDATNPTHPLASSRSHGRYMLRLRLGGKTPSQPVAAGPQSIVA